MTSYRNTEEFKFKCIDLIEDFRLCVGSAQLEELVNNLAETMNEQLDYLCFVWSSDIIDTILAYLLDNLKDSVLKDSDRYILETVINLHGYLHFY